MREGDTVVSQGIRDQGLGPSAPSDLASSASSPNGARRGTASADAHTPSVSASADSFLKREPFGAAEAARSDE